MFSFGMLVVCRCKVYDFFLVAEKSSTVERILLIRSKGRSWLGVRRCWGEIGNGYVENGSFVEVLRANLLPLLLKRNQLMPSGFQLSLLLGKYGLVERSCLGEPKEFFVHQADAYGFNLQLNVCRRRMIYLLRAFFLVGSNSLKHGVRLIILHFLSAS